MMQKELKYIGIDPGVKTGFAVYNPIEKKIELETIQLHQGFFKVLRLRQEFEIEIVIEDPNKWTFFKKEDTSAGARRQGAGSVKRDFKAWKDFFEDFNIPFYPVRPERLRNQHAKDEVLFRRITGYTGKSSEHARVAGMLVWQRNPGFKRIDK